MDTPQRAGQTTRLRQEFDVPGGTFVTRTGTNRSSGVSGKLSTVVRDECRASGGGLPQRTAQLRDYVSDGSMVLMVR
jgi:hypothetical protein